MKKVAAILLLCSCSAATIPQRPEAEVVDFGYWKEDVQMKPAAKKTETSWPLVTVFIIGGILLWQQ